LNDCKVAWNPLTGAPALGHKRVLADDRSKAIKLLMFARLLKRMFEIDVQHCPNFGG
jgi:hypothetical protein